MWMLPVLLVFSPLSSAEEARRDALTRYGLARIAARSGQTATAEKHLAAAAKADPASVAVTRDRIRVLADLGRDAAALRLVGDLEERSALDAGTGRIVARLHREARHYDFANHYYANALLIVPANRPAAKLAIQKEFIATLKDAQEWTMGAAMAEGMAQFVQDNFNTLKTEYDAVELHRERAWALEKRGQFEIERKQLAAAMDAFRAAAALCAGEAKDPNGVVRLHWNVANAHARSDATSLALKELESYLKYKPKSVAAYSLYSDLLLKTKTPAAAEIDYKRLLTSHADIQAVAWGHAALVAKYDFNASHQEFLTLAKTTSREECWQLLVKTYFEAQQPVLLLQLADDLFPAAPDVFPRKPIVVAAEVSDRQQAFAAALGMHLKFAPALLKASADGKLHSAELWEILGWIAEKSDQPEALERSLLNCIQSRRDDPNATAFEKLARHYAQTRQWRKLLTLCDNGQGFEVYRAMLRSEAFAELGQRDKAFSAVRQTAGFANFASQRQIVHLHALLGEHDAMLKKCDAMLLEFTQDDAEVRKIRISRADAYLGLNRIDDMEAELRGLLEDDPDDPLVLNNLGYNLADRNRKLADAEVFVRRAISIDRHNRAKAGEPFAVSGVYLDSLGWVQFRRGDLKTARATLEEAVALPDGRPDAVVWDHLGDVCFRLNDKPAAKTAWQNAATRYQNDHRGKQQGRADEVTRKLALCP